VNTRRRRIVDDFSSQNNVEEFKAIPKNPVVLVGGKAKD
jgi:hypothetical protein